MSVGHELLQRKQSQLGSQNRLNCWVFGAVCPFIKTNNNQTRSHDIELRIERTRGQLINEIERNKPVGEWRPQAESIELLVGRYLIKQ